MLEDTEIRVEGHDNMVVLLGHDPFTVLVSSEHGKEPETVLELNAEGMEISNITRHRRDEDNYLTIDKLHIAREKSGYAVTETYINQRQPELQPVTHRIVYRTLDEVAEAHPETWPVVKDSVELLGKAFKQDPAAFSIAQEHVIRNAQRDMVLGEINR